MTQEQFNVVLNAMAMMILHLQRENAKLKSQLKGVPCADLVDWEKEEP